MNVIYGVFKTILYYMMVFVFYYFIKKRQNKKVVIKWESHRKMYDSKSVGLFQALLYAFAFGTYAVYITAEVLTNDRKNYAHSYLIDRELTPAVNLIFDFWRNITDNPKVLFFTFSFIMLFLILIACRENKQFLPKAFSLMVASNLLIFSYNGLKQAPAIAFVAIGISLWLEKKYAVSLICIALAISFHESALVAIPMIILLVGAKKRWVRVVEYVVLALFVVAFPTMTQLVTKLLGIIDLSVLEEVDSYLDEDGGLISGFNMFTAIKGMPFYLISSYGLLCRKKLKDKINHYDKYLVMSIFASAMFVLSTYMYWMFRFGIYFYFFAFIFAAQLIRESANKKMANRFYYTVLMLFLLINIRYYLQYFMNYGGF